MVSIKRVLFIVCRNGLGHMRRVLQVADALTDCAHDISVTIAGDVQSVEFLVKFPPAERLKNSDNVSFIDFRAYPVWTDDPEFFTDDNLLVWHKALLALDVDSYDLVVSDNLAEVLKYRPDTIMMGSFLWHEVYATAHNTPVVSQYHDLVSGLLADYRPPMIANKYFAMPSVAAETDMVGVGMLPSAVYLQPSVDRMRAILLLSSRKPDIEKIIIDEIENYTASPDYRPDIAMYVSRDVYTSHQWDSPVFPFNFGEHSFGDFPGVAGRPGMGLMTDCIASHTPLFCIALDNAEIERNASIIEELGVGVSLDRRTGFIKEMLQYLENNDYLRRYRNAVAQIDMDGLNQTVEYLMAVLEER